jgi:outer membrane lipoprotein-sorting protein
VMKFKAVLSCLLAFLLCQSVYAMTGREIMEKSDALPEPDTAKSKIMMLIHKGGKVIEKEFTLQMKQFDNDEDKALISFIRPTQIKLLTHSHKGRDDDQWLRLSSGKIKRIVSTGRDKPFVNSHFYYEDLTSIDIDDYAYKFLGEGNAVEEDCFKVEGVKQIGEKIYDKVVFYLRKSDFFVVRVDFYKDGKFHKFLENYHVKIIDGILTPHKVKMELANGKGNTELVLKGLKYNTDIDSSKFNKEALR